MKMCGTRASVRGRVNVGSDSFPAKSALEPSLHLKMIDCVALRWKAPRKFARKRVRDLFFRFETKGTLFLIRF